MEICRGCVEDARTTVVILISFSWRFAETLLDVTLEATKAFSGEPVGVPPLVAFNPTAVNSRAELHHWIQVVHATLLCDTGGPDRVDEEGNIGGAEGLRLRLSSLNQPYQVIERMWMIAGLRTFRTRYVVQARPPIGEEMIFGELEQGELAKEVVNAGVSIIKRFGTA
jgi:hypothetical protein